MPRFAGVEGGGTTFRAAIAVDDPQNIEIMESFPTTTPEETLQSVADWLRQQGAFDAMGIATFGPVDPDKSSETYGFITNTPKTKWVNTDVLGFFRKQFPGIPYRFDTDVNAPALAEFSMNMPKDATSCMYVTVGTGVGVGLVVNRQPVHGLVHPEGGHVKVPRRPNDADNFSGTCMFHGDCVEGICASGALAAFHGCDPSELPSLSDDEEVWDVFAHTMGGLCATAVLLVSPERIVLSGGVMKRKSLFPKVRAKAQEFLNAYVKHPAVLEDIDNYITPSPWGDEAGMIGSLNLAKLALEDAEGEKDAGDKSKSKDTTFYVGLLVICIAIPVAVTVGVLVGHYFSTQFTQGNTGAGYHHTYDPEQREEIMRMLSKGAEGSEL